MDYVARLSYIFQSGVPKMDIVLYQKLTTYPAELRNYQPSDLENAGKCCCSKFPRAVLTAGRLRIRVPQSG